MSAKKRARFKAVIAFVPVEVLLVMLIIHRLLSNREKQAKMNKLNMVIGAFFGEVGAYLLRHFSRLDHDSATISKELIIKEHWTKKRLASVKKQMRSRKFGIDF